MGVRRSFSEITGLQSRRAITGLPANVGSRRNRYAFFVRRLPKLEMSLGTSKKRTAYLAFLGEVLQRPGHHYMYHMEYKSEQVMEHARHINPGFTARAFFYNKEGRGLAEISIYYKSGAFVWYMEMKYENGKMHAIHKKKTDGKSVEPDINIENDSIYSLMVHCKDEENMEGYIDKTMVHEGSVEKIPGYKWDITLQNEHQKLLSLHLTYENPAAELKVSDYWGSMSYLEKQWVPTGTVGVIQCVLVDKSAPHWLQLRDYRNNKHKVEFQSGALKQDSELCYIIRLSPVAYIVTTSFDFTSKAIYDSNGANYIQVEFSPAVYIKRYDMKIPYFKP
ncbi:uncharacterized protein [Dermacentor albipictus]|uniref:uncharacterized protein isoform X2 n=1 Tax=Dermacentor albipictus TaxID=60249 RepID=UPI0038FD2A53